MGRQELARSARAASRGDRRRPQEDRAIGEPAAALDCRVGADSVTPALKSPLVQLRERRHLLEVVLSPLNESETRELIALRLNCQTTELAGDLVHRVHAQCGGNPFFVAETVRDWYEKQAITRSETRVGAQDRGSRFDGRPETVRDVMRLRLQGLPTKAQQVVSAAAVIGAVVDIDLLRENSSGPERIGRARRD